MSLLLLQLATSAHAQAPCPDRNDRLDLVDEAEDALVEADLATVERRLRKLDDAWSCGAVADRELLGRVWLVEGAYLTLKGDTEAGSDTWRAAARVAPGVWVDAFGDRLREQYEEALSQSGGTAQIVVQPELFEYVGAVDGEPARFPVDVQAGLHLVQVGPDLDTVEFSRDLLVQQGGSSVVETGIIEGATRPTVATTAAEPTLVRADGWPIFEAAASLHIAVGADLAMGRPAENAAATEPAVKLLLPLETGLVVRPTTGLWVRAALVTAPVVVGPLVYEDAFGPTSSSTALGPQLAGGGHTDQGDFGALAAYQWPGRFAVRALYSGRPSELPVRFEGRLGLNLPSGAPPEPALGVVIAFTPLVVDRTPTRE